jgi:hypothetical protein
MRQALKLHPDGRSASVTGIEVDIARPGASGLLLRYVISGAIEGVRLPPVTAPARADELWRHTCLEAFVGVGDGYTEFNFAPSTQWAAYRFDGYRSGMRAADVSAPRIEVRDTAEAFVLQAAFDLPAGAVRLGLSAVIEEISGDKSYWALAHAPGAPDFHHADAFAYVLPADQT